MRVNEGRILGVKRYIRNDDAMLDDAGKARIQYTAVFYASSFGRGWGGSVEMDQEQVVARLKKACDDEKPILLSALKTMKSPGADAFAAAAGHIVQKVRTSNPAFNAQAASSQEKFRAQYDGVYGYRPSVH